MSLEPERKELTELSKAIIVKSIFSWILKANVKNFNLKLEISFLRNRGLWSARVGNFIEYSTYIEFPASGKSKLCDAMILCHCIVFYFCFCSRY